MFPKKICSLGILDINLNLVLRKAQAENYNFNINKYNTVEDLEKLFYPKENENEKNININYIDYISLSSNNNLINTLLFINRAYKTKTFVEFIMLNQMEFSESTKFVRKLLQEIFDKNYFFIIENKILDIPSKIKFTIKILNNDNDEIISMKSFELFEINEIEVEQNLININNEDREGVLLHNNKYGHILNIDKINYNFMETNYFLFDLNIIKDLKLSNNKDFSIFIYEIIKKYPKIKIILIIDDNINSIEKKDLKLNKKLIELSDIIFSFNDKLNNFYKIYNLTIKNNIKDNNKENMENDNVNIIGNQKMKKYDLITEDRDKCRKNIPRLTIIFEQFNNISIYKQQGIQMKIDFIEIFNIKATNNIKNIYITEYLYTNSNKFYHIFIAGFLSRIINEKSLRVCVGAGDLLMEKSLFLFMNNIDYINDIDKFNVLVPNIKKNNKNKKNEKLLKEYEKLVTKENKFILDCTNILKCKKKEYNPLFDENCASYLLKDNHLKHLQNIGFINKNGVILKDPDNIRKKENNINSLKNIVKNRILTENNFFLRNNKLPISRTSYNTINTNYDSKDIKNSPKFKSVFSPIFDKKINNQIALSPNLKNIFKLPKMKQKYYNLSNKELKGPNNTESNLRKSKSMATKNNNDLIKYKKNLTVNNSSINKKYLHKILRNTDNNFNYFTKIIKKIMSQK